MMADQNQRMRMIATVSVAVVSLVAMISLHWLVDRKIAEEHPDTSKQTLPSPQSVSFFSLGYDRVLSDLFWLGFIQYLGESRERGVGYRSAYDYTDLITTLDPYFLKAYWFGCWAIGYWQERPDLADKLIRRGMEYNPREYYLPYMGGVNQFMYAKNFKGAAQYYRIASKLPGAPEFLANQIKTLESNVPELEKRFQTLGTMFNSSKDEDLRASVRPELVKVLRDLYASAVTPAQRKTAAENLRNLGVDPVTGHDIQ